MNVTNILQRQVNVLTRVVDDLLDVARIAQGRIELKRRNVQLTEIVTQAVETVDPLLKAKHHRITVVSSRPLRVHADATRLVQCMVNILTNAAKYTDEGGEIRVESSEEAGEAVLTVTDNGPGIAPELLPHVFDLFVQSDRTLDRAQGGLGIGLSLVKRLIELHEGRVLAASPGAGQGSSFQIRLPLQSRGDERRYEPAAPPAPTRRILIVDDNIDAANSLGMLLQLEGHEVELAYIAREALARVPVFKPELVLLDIGLPHMDGYELARRIRALPEGTNIQLVALTGYGQAEDKARTKSAGFDEHLIKPVDFEALRRVVRRDPPGSSPDER
jgi:CheY-like chemotaxis protein/two-component sensor histidine kinase